MQDNLGRAFLDALAVGETYDPTEYNELVGGGHFDNYDAFPVWEGKRFSTGISHAAGRYQFEPATWTMQKNKLRLNSFNPLAQDIAAWDLAVTVYKVKAGRDLAHDLSRGVLIYSALAGTWPSINEKTLERFRGAYAARRTIAKGY